MKKIALSSTLLILFSCTSIEDDTDAKWQDMPVDSSVDNAQQAETLAQQYDDQLHQNKQDTRIINPITQKLPLTYEVKKGDTLCQLARDFYNDEKLWKLIFMANHENIANANKIFVGQKLTIPAQSSFSRRR